MNNDKLTWLGMGVQNICALAIKTPMMSYYLDPHVLMQHSQAGQQHCRKYGIKLHACKSPQELKAAWHAFRPFLDEKGRLELDTLSEFPAWLKASFHNTVEPTPSSSELQLEPFYSAAMEGRDQFPDEGVILDSEEFRQKLLSTVHNWHDTLRPQPSELRPWYHVKALKRLCEFAHLAKQTQSPILVAPFDYQEWERWREGYTY